MKKRKETTMQRNLNDSNLAVYLKEINRFPLMTREEEERTAHEAASGSKEARDKLINSNLRFVVNVAKKYQGLGLGLEDLISEGNTGLLNAVDRFDVTKGYHFISYAVWWIRQAIMSALCEKTKMIRLPSNRAVELIKIEKARKYVKNRHSHNEEISEIAEILNMDKNKVSDLVNISREIISLDNYITSDNDTTLVDFIEDSQNALPEEVAEYKMMEADIDNALKTLKKDEAEILRCHFGLGCRPMSLKEIGLRYNLSKERIRQIEERALSRLRNPKKNKKLRAYVA